MSLRINHNIASLNGHRNMVKNDRQISVSLEKLSSGLRINRAADDAAGLVISEQMRAQVAGLNQAINNSETAVSMVQTAEGAFDEMNSLLNKARQLAIHAANTGVNDTNALSADQSELDNIISSITRIAENTQFGTKKLLDGTLANAIVTDAGSDLISSITLGKVDTTVIAIGLADISEDSVDGVAAEDEDVLTAVTTGDFSGIFGAGTTVATAIIGSTTFAAATTVSIEGAAETIEVDMEIGETVATALSRLNIAAREVNAGVTYSIGAAGAFTATATDVGEYSDDYDLTFTSGAMILNLGDMSAGDTAGVNAEAIVLDSEGTEFTMTLDVADRGYAFHSDDATVDLSITFSSIDEDGTVGAFEITEGAVFQIGANRDQTVTLSIASSKATDLAKEAVDGDGLALDDYESLDSLRVDAWLTSGRAQDAISAIDKAIDEITVTRGELGAIQSNTLESGLNGLRVSQENLNAAESTIRDVDFAAESSNFTRNSILIQSATAMLAQANQLPQNVLKLLG
jgi:flagellin